MQYSEEGDDSYYDSYYEVNTKHTYQCLLSTIVHPDPIWFELWEWIQIRIQEGRKNGRKNCLHLKF